MPPCWLQWKQRDANAPSAPRVHILRRTMKHQHRQVHWCQDLGEIFSIWSLSLPLDRLVEHSYSNSKEELRGIGGYNSTVPRHNPLFSSSTYTLKTPTRHSGYGKTYHKSHVLCQRRALLICGMLARKMSVHPYLASMISFVRVGGISEVSRVGEGLRSMPRDFSSRGSVFSLRWNLDLFCNAYCYTVSEWATCTKLSYRCFLW